MNHVYRVIWNGSAACWQAVSETARGRSKSSKSTAKVLKPLLMAASVAVSGVAMAAPTGGTVASGTASIGVSGNTTTINQGSAKAVINWNDFSIANGEAVNFVQPDANAIALNRVTSAAPSSIQGALNANGQVFIVNPNGITFGSTAQVNVGGLVASTLDISDSDFNNGSYRFANTANNAVISNQGTISVADAGTAALIAPSIQQAGSIVSKDGSIILTAATDVTLGLSGRSFTAQSINAGHKNATVNHSAGLLQADGGKVVLTAQGVNSNSTASIHSAGTIQAQTLSGNNRGSIELTTDTRSGVINLTGTLDASAPTNGFGGSIYTTAADVKVADSASVTTRKVNQNTLPGSSSLWQIKANAITVGAGGTLSGSKLGNSLNDGSVSLVSNGSAAGKGSIDINEAVSSNANSILTLSARRDVNINKDVSLTANLGKLVLKYGASNDYNLNHGSKINLSGANAGLQLNGVNYIVINSLGVAGDTSTTTLQGMKNNLTGNYVLGSDIDASATSTWNNSTGFQSIGSIGTSYGTSNVVITGNPFSGQLHGLGHQINSIAIGNQLIAPFFFGNSTAQVDVGFFGTLSGLLRDVHVTGNAKGSTMMGAVGLLAGIVSNGTIKNSSGSGLVSSVASIAGGLVGADATSLGISNIPQGTLTILNSSFSGDVSGGVRAVGGLAGLSAGHIGNSYYTYNNQTGLSVFHYSNAIISMYPYLANAKPSVGGLVGVLGNGGSISNSYAQSTLPNEPVIGGLVGTAEAGTSVTNSFWNSTLAGGASAGGTGKTTAELKQIATFTGWDIADVSNTTSNSTWVIDQNNSTPWLR